MSKSHMRTAGRARPAPTRKNPSGSEVDDKRLLERLGLAMRVARVSRDLTQRELAAHVGVSQHLIWSIEAGKRDPGILLLQRAAKTLGIPIEFFLIAVADARPSSSSERQM